MTDKRQYTRRELRCLWAGFAGESDESERLAGFADCSVEQAAAMIKSFRTTAAARKAAAAEEARKQKPPRKKKAPAQAEDEEVVEIGELFPATDLIAAAVNAGHKLSIVEASGMAFGRRKSVIVERISYHGEYYHRVKFTQYSHYKTRSEAIEAARKHKLKLTIFNDSE